MKISSLLLLLCSLGFVACQKTEKMDVKPDKGWETVVTSDGSEPRQRHEAAFVDIEDKFYLLGGRGILPTSIYDTKTNSWSEGAPPPIELHHFQPIIFENKVYIVGALTGGFPEETPVPNVYIYHPDTDSWEKGHEIPEDRRRGSTGNVLYQNQVFIASGIKNGHVGDHKKWFDRYDPVTGEWEALTDTPRTRDHFQAVLAGDKMVLVAGRLSNAPENSFNLTIPEVDVFDFGTNSWSTLDTNLPTQRAGNMAVFYEGEVLVVGGESSSQIVAHSEVEALNVENGSWRILPSLQRGRHGSGVFEFNGKLYTASGSGNRGGEPELFSLERY